MKLYSWIFKRLSILLITVSCSPSYLPWDDLLMLFPPSPPSRGGPAFSGPTLFCQRYPAPSDRTRFWFLFLELVVRSSVLEIPSADYDVN